MPPSLSRLLFALSLLCVAAFLGSADELRVSSPAAESRFPPLSLPPGFKATLFACDPTIEYPSVIALGPRLGSLFVAIDYMTGLGTDIVRRDEIRLLEDTDGDGYADKVTTVAEGFNSIQGLAFFRDKLYVMNAPYLSAVPLDPNTGKAGKRQDLLTGLGLAPEKDQIRLHNANGVVPGHDGWLYLALGDRGCDVMRPEGDRLVLEGGGILRCRPDGLDLHVFSTGLRNIYDVALDEDLNVFVRDNENDGGDYKIRVCHSFFGADHGYPYHYLERPDEALPPLGDLGLGSAAGGVCYLEKQFPPEYRGNLFFCEWGRSVVRAPLKRSKSSFAAVKEIEFAAGAPNDPYGFKPTDIVVDRDGSMFISDWADGQRPKRGRGRIYQVKYKVGDGKDAANPRNAKKAPPYLENVVRLGAPSHAERLAVQEWLAQLTEGRTKELVEVLEACWKGNVLEDLGKHHALGLLKNTAATPTLFTLLRVEKSPRVQAQIIRTIADITDPDIVKKRLNAGPGDPAAAKRLADSVKDRPPQVVLETVVALGRLRWTDTPAWLNKNLGDPDPALAHAAQWALRRSENWAAIFKLLDGADTPIRDAARRSLADQYVPEIADGLIDRLRSEKASSRQREYAGLLARVYKKPATPWVYWGFRPGVKPVNTVAWEKTEAIEKALDLVLVSADRGVRLDILRAMVREKVPAKSATLSRWLLEERTTPAVAALVNALAERPAEESRPAFEAVIRDKTHDKVNRLLAAAALLQGIDAQSEERLLAVAEATEDGPVLAELLRGIGKRQAPKSALKLALAKTKPATSAEVRAAALFAAVELAPMDALAAVREALADADAQVLAEAARAAGKLKLTAASERLLKCARHDDAEVRRAALHALKQLREPKALPVAVALLADRDVALDALSCVAELGGPEQANAVVDIVRRQPSADVLAAAAKALAGWHARTKTATPDRARLDDAFAQVHGASGMMLAWRELRSTLEDADKISSLDDGLSWRLALASGLDPRLKLSGDSKRSIWFARADVALPEAAKVDLFTASTGLETIHVNGKEVFQRAKPGVIGPYPDRFEASFNKGLNKVLVRLDVAPGKPAEFQLRFRRKSAAPDHDRFTLASLSRAGNPARGKEVFLNAEKSLCLKCHKVGETGEKVGPDLTGLGSRFAKVHIIESILDPSRAISPSYETVAVVLKSDKILSGIKVAESPTSVTLVDVQAQKHTIAREQIAEMQKTRVSTMPDGLEKRLSEDEFVDLISYLVSLRAK